MDGQPLQLEDIGDAQIERAVKYFKSLGEGYRDSLFKPQDVFMVHHKRKLYQVSRKDIMEEALKRENKKRQQKIKDKLKSMNYDKEK